MLAIEPRSDNGGNEELGAVAGEESRVSTEFRQKRVFTGGGPVADEPGKAGGAYVLGPALAMDSRPGRVCL